MFPYIAANSPPTTTATAASRPISFLPAAPVLRTRAPVPVAVPEVITPVGPETAVVVIAAVLVHEHDESNEAVV